MLAVSYPIPDSALDSDIAILGRKGGGKTFTAKGIVERLLDMGRRVLVLDPLGVWAGLRTGADGESPGYPVAVFGGLHADMPLDTAAAEPMAAVIARENVPAVIDLSELSKHAQQSFLLSFLHELRRVNTEALTIVLEEADVFAPQNPLGDDSKALHGEIDWIARRGRFRGFRLITVTQRPARLSKDVLTQCATMVVHRMPAPQDQSAVKAWIDGNGDGSQTSKVIESLSTLPVGEAWVWASEDGTLGRFKFPRIKTLDTSATPKAGERRIEPKTLAQVDVSGIRAALQEAQKAAAQPNGGKGPAVRQEIEPAEIEAAERRGYERGYADGQAIGRTQTIGLLRDAVAGLTSTIERIEDGQSQLPPPPDLKPFDTLKEAVPDRSPRTRVTEPAGGLTGPQQKVLRALALWRSIGFTIATREQVAAVAGYSPSSGGFNNLLGQLRTAGHIDYPEPGKISATDAARMPHQRDGRTVIEIVSDHLSRPQQTIVRALARHVRPTSRDDLAKATDYSASSGGFNNLLSSLRTLGVIDYPSKGFVQLEDWMRK